MSETSKKKNLPRYRGHSRLTKAGQSGNLSVPSDMMLALSEGLLFKPEFTKDGILFRVVDETKMIADEKVVPAWVKKVAAPAPSKASTSSTGPIPPVDDEHPDSDDSDDAIVDDEPEYDPETVSDLDSTDEEGDDEPPVTDDDTPF